MENQKIYIMMNLILCFLKKNKILVAFEATVEYIKANLLSHCILFDAIERLSEEKFLESTKNYVKHIFSIK